MQHGKGIVKDDVKKVAPERDRPKASELKVQACPTLRTSPEGGGEPADMVPLKCLLSSPGPLGDSSPVAEVLDSLARLQARSCATWKPSALAAGWCPEGALSSVARLPREGL